MTNNEQQLSSQVVSFLRFPLVVCVVAIHADVLGISGLSGRFVWTDVVVGAFSDFVFMANAFFFFISGFLFFRQKTFNSTIYKGKLLRRVRTLLVPYVLWNAAYLAFIGLAEWWKPTLQPALHMSLADMGWREWLLTLWDIAAINGGTTHAPVAVQFWFVRDLMVVSLLSPVVYIVVRGCAAAADKLKNAHFIAFLCFLAVVFLFSVMPNVVGLSSTAWLYFSVGAFLGVRGVPFCRVMYRMRWYTTVLSVLFFVLSEWLMRGCSVDETGVFGGFFMELATLSVISGTVGWCVYGIEKRRWHMPDVLSRSSFFVFAYHSILLGMLLYVVKGRMATAESGIEVITVNVLLWAVLVVTGVVLHRLLQRMMPRLVALLTGGR